MNYKFYIKKGFSLIELVVVIIIIGIITRVFAQNYLKQGIIMKI